MSYKYETQYNSPNFTSAANVPKTWGRSRTIDAIAIHWWGDPNTNPTYEGVVNYLCRKNGTSSAHYVATGTGRKVACLVSPSDAAWATNSANPYTVSIECDPRCRDEDYDVVAELISQIWDAYGYKPLVPHRQFVATACPGNYDLARLEALAKTKNGSGDWGNVTNKVTTPTAPTPDNLYRLSVDGKQVAAYSSEKNSYAGYVTYGSKGTIKLNGKDVTASIIAKYKPVEPKPEPEIKPDPPISTPEPSKPESGTPTQPENETPTQGSKTLWDDIVVLFNKLVEFLKKYKRSK